jgi:2-polyprenyl-3-methyl-5-hydroxy-6-metoxy-1,4-benzoquinol methylase
MVRRVRVAQSYDHYYGSGVYDVRYPRPNPSTYRCALQLASSASRILDFGAGSGRYTMPLLHSTDAFFCAYDISVDACELLKIRASSAGVASQRLLVTSDLDVACAAGPYELALVLFGVLSHIEKPDDRMNVLTSIRSMLAPAGRFLVTVPNSFRRFPLHASRPGSDIDNGGGRSLLTFMRSYFPHPRLITYCHYLENVREPFPYYLFSRQGLARELSDSSFLLDILEADSMLPERNLVRNSSLGPVDSFLCWMLPAWAGYGLRAVCRPGPVC